MDISQMFGKKNIILLMILLLFILTSCDNAKSTYEEYADAINNNFDTTVYLYGDDIDFKYGFKYESINSLAECKSTSKYCYLILNLNLFNYNLTDSDLKVLDDLINKKGYKIIYVHIDSYFEKFKNSNYNLYDKSDDLRTEKLYLYDKTASSISSREFTDFIILNFIITNIKVYEIK